MVIRWLYLICSYLYVVFLFYMVILPGMKDLLDLLWLALPF